MRTNLDLLREEYTIKARVARKYDVKVFLRTFIKRDLVLENMLKDGTTNKLTPNWKGTFRIIEVVPTRAIEWQRSTLYLVLCQFVYLLQLSFHD
ncbi:hypothetical protein CR513_23547, partial [Mucuna pruriens]